MVSQGFPFGHDFGKYHIFRFYSLKSTIRTDAIDESTEKKSWLFILLRKKVI